MEESEEEDDDDDDEEEDCCDEDGEDDSEEYPSERSLEEAKRQQPSSLAGQSEHSYQLFVEAGKHSNDVQDAAATRDHRQRQSSVEKQDAKSTKVGQLYYNKRH